MLISCLLTTKCVHSANIKANTDSMWVTLAYTNRMLTFLLNLLTRSTTTFILFAVWLLISVLQFIRLVQSCSQTHKLCQSLIDRWNWTQTSLWLTAVTMKRRLRSMPTVKFIKPCIFIRSLSGRINSISNTDEIILHHYYFNITLLSKPTYMKYKINKIISVTNL